MGDMFSARGLLVALLAASVQGHSQLKFSPFNWLLKSSARSGSVSEAPVKVSVYYESLCPDSQLFVYDQLAPTFEIFGPEELVVDLKPFGKANWTESNGSWDFTCQHGPRECYNNMVQACILNQVPNTEEHVPLIGCIMSTGVIGSEDACLEELGITTTSPGARTLTRAPHCCMTSGWLPTASILPSHLSLGSSLMTNSTKITGK